MFQKDARRAGIFCQYEIHFLEDTDGTKCHVFHVAYWGRNNV